MCLVIDITCLSKVFGSANKEHSKFEPVFDWIYNKNGKIIYGGTHYKKELIKLPKYLRILRYFRETDKVVVGDCNAIDSEEQRLIKIDKTHKYNDHHIIAIVIITSCRLICTDDIKLIEMAKKKKYYPNKFRLPKLYVGYKSNKKLLCDKYIADICKPCKKMTAREKSKFL